MGMSRYSSSATIRWPCTQCWLLPSTPPSRASRRSSGKHASPSTPVKRPRWPMIVLRTPKGWTGPKFVDGKPVEGTWRAHQVPIAELKQPEHLRQLEEWMLSYEPRELFDEQG